MSSQNNSIPWRLEWSGDLSVGIPEIDAEHQYFMQLINELNEAIAARMDIEVVRQRMQAILDDALAHFAYEERLFKAWHYPDAERHAQKHAEAVQFFQGILAGFKHDSTDYEWIEAGLRVKQALVEHLLTEDMKYRDFWIQQSALQDSNSK